MPNPYSSPEITQTGDPTMGQAGVQNSNVNDNLYAASYPGAPGRAADTSMPGGGSDLASQGLAKLQQGDEYGGIMTLLDAAKQNPAAVQSDAFLQQLQLVESQPGRATGVASDSGQFSAPTDSPAYGTTSDAAAMNPQTAGGSTDANSLANQALSVAQSNPAEGILGLMQASTQNPDLLNDQNFLTTMSEVLPQGQGAVQGQQAPMDGSQIQQQQQAPMDGSQIQQQQQAPMDGSQVQQQQQVPMDGSQVQQQQQAPMDGSQQAVAPTYTMPAQLTSSGDPNIEAGVKQAFQLIQSGDQFDGARLLMMIAKADPAILQDQTFVKNLVDLENAMTGKNATAASDQSDQTQSGAQQYDAQGNPLDASGNPITQQQYLDASGNPIAQPGAQQYVDASGNPIAQPGAQQYVDASGNPIAQPGAQQYVDASGNPIAQPGSQGMTGMSVPSDTSTQVASSNDPTVGAPTS